MEEIPMIFLSSILYYKKDLDVLCGIQMPTAKVVLPAAKDTSGRWHLL
jgi:hypothetical protein